MQDFEKKTGVFNVFFLENVDQKIANPSTKLAGDYVFFFESRTMTN